MKNQLSQTIRLRLVVMTPLPGVRYAVQRGKTELLQATDLSPGVLQFDLALRMGAPLVDGGFNFLGEYAQGTPADRFIYLNSGKYAGQVGTDWARRAKLKLAMIPRAMLEGASASEAVIVEARILGSMKDGGPICATVKSDAIGWRLVRSDD